MVGDGVKEYDHHNDGKTFELAGCSSDFRSQPHKTRFKVKYIKDTSLSVCVDVGTKSIALY